MWLRSSQPNRPTGLAGVLEFFCMVAGSFQGFALRNPFPYTDASAKRSILIEGADHGNAHDLSVR